MDDANSITEILLAVIVRFTVFWDVTPCSVTLYPEVEGRRFIRDITNYKSACCYTPESLNVSANGTGFFAMFELLKAEML